VAISQKNRVLSRPVVPTGTNASEKQIGVLSTFDYSESRSIDPVRGVGFGDQILELVPGVTEPMSLTLNRTMLYTAGIVQELGYKGGVDGIVRSLRQHRWPFDIKSELAFSELVQQADRSFIGTNTSGGSTALITYFWACWLNNYDVSFPSDSAIIVENASATATDVTDGFTAYQNTAETYGSALDSGNNPYTTPNSGSLLYK
jgi:hypothetical protein